MCDYDKADKYLSAHYVLNPKNGLSIDFKDQSFVPIGTGHGNSISGGFKGSFDGNGKKIKNLSISNNIHSEISTSSKGTGLFAFINGATIKNLVIENADINVSSKAKYYSGTGVLAGAASNNVIIENVSVSGKINGKGYTCNVGGFIGSIDGNCSIVNCSTTSEITGYELVGGFTGFYCGGNITNCFSSGNVTGKLLVGGFVGEDFNGKIIDSYALGDVSGNTRQCGGFIAMLYYGEVTNCFAKGNVYGEENVGGFIGEIYDNWSPKINNCYATGDITATQYVGGFIGKGMDGEVNNCYSTGLVYGKCFVGGFIGYHSMIAISKSYATGNVIGTSRVGGFVGYPGSIRKTRNSYALGNVRGDDEVGGFSGTKAPEFPNTYRFSEQIIVGKTNDFGSIVTYQQLTNSSFISSLLGSAFLLNNGLNPKLYTDKNTSLLPQQPDILIRSSNKLDSAIKIKQNDKLVNIISKNNDVNIEICVSNGLLSSKKIKLLIASYDNESKLINLTMLNDISLDSRNLGQYNFDINKETLLDGVRTLKVFVWDGSFSVQPLSKGKVIPVEDL